MFESFEKFKKEAISFITTVSILVGIAFLIIRPTLIEPFQIPSSSMEPTLQITDRILVNKLSYGLRIAFVTNTIFNWSVPSRGDVVVFTRPDEKDTEMNESEVNFIKRVIGLPGDTIEVKGPHLFVNNQLQDEPYARYSHGGSAAGNFGPVTVPSGHIFLMGDNRDDSKDSRFWEEPFLEIGRVKGRAFMIYWSFAGFGRLFNIIR
jgi:signal peptidase I